MNAWTKSLVSLSFSALIAVATSGCARNRTEVVEEKPSTRAQEVAAEIDSQIVSSVAFRKGKRVLGPAARAQLDNAVREAKERGDIDEIHVAVWSDVDYPAKGEDVPSRQVTLAAERGERIEDYLERKADVAGVKVHNMSKRPTALAELFRTDDATLKSKLASRGLAMSDGPNGTLGRTSSALVFIKLKE